MHTKLTQRSGTVAKAWMHTYFEHIVRCVCVCIDFCVRVFLQDGQEVTE